MFVSILENYLAYYHRQVLTKGKIKVYLRSRKSGVLWQHKQFAFLPGREDSDTFWRSRWCIPGSELTNFCMLSCMLLNIFMCLEIILSFDRLSELLLKGDNGGYLLYANLFITLLFQCTFMQWLQLPFTMTFWLLTKGFSFYAIYDS